jgi:hypothetical protein
MAKRNMNAGIGVIVCCGLLWLAVPRFIASLYALYPETAFKQTQDKLPADVYKKSIDNLTHALAWHENAEYFQTQAFFYLALFNSSLTQPFTEKQQLLKQARTSIIEGLKLSPVDPYAWFRLATVDKALKMPSQQIINSLRLSLYAGRVEPDLLMPRLSFSYYYYDEFDEEMRDLWQKQLPVAWAFHADQLIQFAALHLETKPLIEATLSPDDWQKFSLDLENYIQSNP